MLIPPPLPSAHQACGVLRLSAPVRLSMCLSRRLYFLSIQYLIKAKVENGGMSPNYGSCVAKKPIKV